MSNERKPINRINKVVIGTKTIIDLSRSPGTEEEPEGHIIPAISADDVRRNKEAWNSNGALIKGELQAYKAVPLYLDNTLVGGGSQTPPPAPEQQDPYAWDSLTYFSVDTCELETADSDGWTYYVGNVDQHTTTVDSLNVTGEGESTGTVETGVNGLQEYSIYKLFLTHAHSGTNKLIDITGDIYGISPDGVVSFTLEEGTIPEGCSGTLRHYTE